MRGRTHILLWAAVSVFLASISYFLYPAVASNRLSSQYIYKHPKLGFSLEYSALLTAQDFPNGVELTNNAVQIYDRINVLVTNTSLEPDRFSAGRAVEYFKRFRKAKAGEIFKGGEFGIGAYTKIEDLKVSGYPAVRVAYEYRPQQNTPPLPNDDPFPPVYAVHVYIQKGTDIWEVVSYGIDKATQEKSATTFEEVLGSLKFA